MFRLVGRSGWFDNQFVAVVFCFFAGGVLPGFRQSLQQVRNLRFVVRLSQHQDQVIQSGLVFRIVLQGQPTLLAGKASLSSLQIKLSQNIVRGGKRRHPWNPWLNSFRIFSVFSVFSGQFPCPEGTSENSPAFQGWGWCMVAPKSL